jgi:hypothetical protein
LSIGSQSTLPCLWGPKWKAIYLNLDEFIGNGFDLCSQGGVAGGLRQLFGQDRFEYDPQRGGDLLYFNRGVVLRRLGNGKSRRSRWSGLPCSLRFREAPTHDDDEK